MSHKTGLPQGLTMLALIACSFALPLRAEEDLRQTVQELRDQISHLNARLVELEKKLGNQEQSSVPDNSRDIKTAERKKPEVGDIKGSIKIPGTDSSLAIGGYVKLDAIYNSQSAGGSGGSNVGDQMLIPGSIPVSNDQKEDDQITFHARQSRFWLKSYTPTEWGDLNTYFELDFFAFQSPGDERVSNSYSPRLRHGYGTLGNFLAGQTWSTFMNAEALPELNDFGGPVGRIFVRQPLLRWTQPFDNGGADFQVALESPETTLTNILGDRQTPDDDNFPDIVARVNLHRSWGSLSLAGMVRNIRGDTPLYGESDVYGGAVSLAGRIKTYHRDDFRFMLNYGNALGRYASSNLLNDGAIDAKGNIELFDQFGGFVAYRHWWNENWRSTAAYGFSYADNPDFVPGTVSKWAHSAQLNLLWSPLLRTTFGLEYTYAARGLENGDSGDQHRIQFSSIFNF